MGVADPAGGAADPAGHVWRIRPTFRLRPSRGSREPAPVAAMPRLPATMRSVRSIPIRSGPLRGTSKAHEARVHPNRPTEEW